MKTAKELTRAWLVGEESSFRDFIGLVQADAIDSVVRALELRKMDEPPGPALGIGLARCWNKEIDDLCAAILAMKPGNCNVPINRHRKGQDDERQAMS